MQQSRDFEDFYAANYGKIAALVTAVTGDRHEAHDIAQETFARALARWPRVSGYELPEAWVRQVAMRLAVDSARRIRRTLRAVPLLRADGRPPAPEPEPGESLAFTALGQALAGCAAGAPGRRRGAPPCSPSRPVSPSWPARRSARRGHPPGRPPVPARRT